MSYGFQLLNSDGYVLANDTDFNYALVASGTATVTGASSGVQINFSNSTSELPIVYVRNASTTYLSKNSIAATYVQIYLFQDALAIDGARFQTTGSFEYRIYLPMKALPTEITGGSEYGIQIFTANGLKTFDSTRSYPLISGGININMGAGDADAETVLPAGAVSNPWVDISNLPTGQIGWKYNGTGNYVVYRCMRVANGKLQVSHGDYYIGGSGPGVNTYWNTQIAKTFLYMNTTSNDPFSASIGESPVIYKYSTCTYDPTATSFCNTQWYYLANYTGGNNNPVSYSWSLNTSATGFFIDGSSTSAQVFVRNTAGGSASPYTAILTCAVSQSGSITQYPNVSLSHTHTAVANPLVITAAVSAQTASCSSTVSCTTQETWTASVTGGNGGAISYLWEFVGAANGFVFSSTNTAATTVSLDSTGAVSGTVYSCTIRCTASQSGMPNVSVDKSVAHTHTTTSGFTIQNPMATGLQGSTSNDSAVGSATVYLYLYPDGTWETFGPSGTLRSGNWGTPTTTGIGSGYSVFFTRTLGSSGSSASSTSYQSLSSNRGVYVIADAFFNNDLKLARYDVQIKDVNTGVVVSTTTNITLEASATYDDGGTAPL